jgi:GntR family transcriptional repressor for pyruvate dehydrogenase complex
MIAFSGAKPGDRFGNEAALERKLGVSRVVIREAVSRLRALGMLDSRQGLGLIVGKPDPFGLLEQTLTRHTLDSADLAALEELRNTLEIGAVELAVNRASEAQIAKLIELAEELGEFQTSSPSPRTADDVELDFHHTILEATHNPMLGQMYPVLAVVFSRREKELSDYPAATTTERAAREHRMIAQAFRDKNAECARVVLSMHLLSTHANNSESPFTKEGP